jgi:eukaryotic-like serine/threonine-protein kinase
MSSNSRPTTFAASGEPVRDNASLPRGREGAAASVGTDALNLSTENAPSFRAAEAAPQAAQLRLGERIADFELLRLLGEGSFGQVFLARQLSLGRDVALKITRNRGNEAQTLASLEHDHIVQVFTEVIDAGRGLRLLCMQYVPGTTLAQVMHRLRQRQRREWSGAALLQAIDELTPHPAPFHPAALRDREFLAAADLCQAVCWLGGRLAEALDHAHSRHVLHRDIKPANILLNHYGRPFLADFNLSFSADPIGGAGAAVFGGTLAYMAPEHLEAFHKGGAAERQAVDERSDLYALGLVLFELLTGERGVAEQPLPAMAGPAPGDEAKWRAALEHVVASRRGLAPSPRSRNPDVSQPLDQVLRRCLDAGPGQRYQTARELASALDGCRQLRRIERELPAPGPLTNAAAGHPFLMLLVLTFFPHVLGSLVNISYNALRIVGDLTPAQQTTFFRLVVGYNLVVYSVCLLALYYLVAPVRRTWLRLAKLEPVATADIDAARRRALSWPGWVVVLSCLGWLPGGILFPVIIHGSSGPVPGAVFGHFLLSFALSGLIALTYAFFGVQFIALRIFYPRLWVDSTNLGETIRRELGPVENRLRLFQLLAGAIPLAGAVLMVAVGPEISGYRTFRLLVTSLLLLGMTGFGLAILANLLLFRILNGFNSAGRRPASKSDRGCVQQPFPRI